MSKIWAIGDLHLDHTKDKSMDIFGQDWKDHGQKIFDYWESHVGQEDWVLIPGDISWALKWGEVFQDLKALDQLPGKKVLSKGNHDYWWTSLKKMNEANFKSLHFIHNTAIQIQEGLYVAGSRGWIPRDAKDFDDKDEKISLRENQRLKNSLDQVPPGNDIIAMIHYPPLLQSFEDSAYTKTLQDYPVKLCLYGHLHGAGHRFIYEGQKAGIQYICVAADYLNFQCKEILWKEK